MIIITDQVLGGNCGDIKEKEIKMYVKLLEERYAEIAKKYYPGKQVSVDIDLELMSSGCGYGVDIATDDCDFGDDSTKYHQFKREIRDASQRVWEEQNYFEEE
jgi:hypothetical protein